MSRGEKRTRESRRRARRHRLPRFAAAVIFAASSSAAAGKDAAGDARSFMPALSAFRDVLAAIETNRAEQDAAWPDREKYIRNELAAPYSVQKLQAELERLEARKQRLGMVLRAAASRDLDAALEALRGVKDRDLAATLVSAVLPAGKDDPRMTEAVIRLARRFDPCPIEIVNALAALENTRASNFLLGLGEESGRPEILRAAGASGEVAVIERLIDLADGDDTPLGKLALDTLGRLTPPLLSGRRRREIVRAQLDQLDVETPEVRVALESALAESRVDPGLERRIALRIASAERRDVKVALIVYLGLCRNPAYLGLFTSTYSWSRDEHVRLAALAALGNLGETAGPFLLDELTRPEASEAIRRACVHALGAARHRPATPQLIAALSEPRLRRLAVRALERLAGEDLGDSEALWRRWWRAQPDSGWVDPDG